MAEFNAHNWIDAQTMMREVKRKYSYSKYARLAELRIADADMEQEKYSDAIREYKEFIRAHRSDEENVAYARSKIAEATLRGDPRVVPHARLRGARPGRRGRCLQGAARRSRNDYPGGKETPHIRELLASVTARLVRHELYVARFYLAKDNYDAAVARVQYALKNYGGGLVGSASVSDGSRAAGRGAAAARPGLPADAQVGRGPDRIPGHRGPVHADAPGGRRAQLPLVHAAARGLMPDPPSPAAVAIPTPSAMPAAPTPRTVLVVDDEKNIRRTLQLVLEGEGYRVLGAETAEQALAHAGQPGHPRRSRHLRREAART